MAHENAMGGIAICRHCPPIWLAVGPKDFHSFGRCSRMDSPPVGVNFVIHYLDDFLMVTPPMVTQALRILVETSKKLGLPIAWDKLEGPSTGLTFLGFELDSI